MNRRALLSRIFATGSVGLSVALSGCGEREYSGDAGRPPDFRMSMDAVTDSEITRRATKMNRLHAEEYEFFASVIEDGPLVTNQSIGGGDQQTIIFESQLYEITREVIDSTPGKRYRFSLEAIEDPPASKTVGYEDLPQVDREKVRREEFGWRDGRPTVGGVPVVYSESAFNRSRLVPTPDNPYIVWPDGTSARLRIEQPSNTTIETYRYTASRYEVTPAEFGRELRKEYAVTLTDLSDGVQDIISKARAAEDMYRVEVIEENDAQPYISLLTQFSRHPNVGDPGEGSNGGGNYIVRYDGDVYWAYILYSRTPEWMGENSTVLNTSSPREHST